MASPPNTFGLGPQGTGCSDLVTCTVPSSGPFTLDCDWTVDGSLGPPMRVFTSGGVAVVMSYKQYGQTAYEALGTVPPYIDIGPGDSLKWTYTIAFPPIVKYQGLST